MRILRLASHWTLGCAALGLLALPASSADAGPTRAQSGAAREAARLAEAQRSDEAGIGRGLVLGMAMSDRFRPSRGIVSPEIQPLPETAASNAQGAARETTAPRDGARRR